MKSDILKRRDAEFDIQQASIINALSANAVAWGIPAATVTDLTTLQSTWAGAWKAAKDRGARTSAQVQAKNIARADYEALLRPTLQSYVQNNPVVTNSDRVAMGIPALDDTRSRSTVPGTTPQVDLKAGNGNIVRIFLKQRVDEKGVSRRAKPDGVDYAEIAVKVGDPAPASADDCPTHYSTGRSPYAYTTNTMDAGKRLYVYVRWVNPRHEAGPWTSDASSMLIS